MVSGVGGGPELLHSLTAPHARCSPAPLAASNLSDYMDSRGSLLPERVLGFCCPGFSPGGQVTP